MRQEFTILTEDGLELKGSYTAPDQVRGVICLIHGMGEHSGRYEHVADFFASHGLAVFKMDLRGHGISQGKRGHTPSYNHLLNDLAALQKTAENTFPGKPLFFYGHSMGGNLVLNYGIRRHPMIAGIIATSPYLTLAFEPPKWKISVARFFTGLIPGLSQPTGLDTKAISKDPEEVRKYENDKLVHDKMSAGFFSNVHFAGPYAIEHAGEMKIPTLVTHGTGDRITSAEGTAAFAKNAGAGTHLKLFEGLFHEMHNEPERDQLFQFVLNWIDSKL